MRDAQQSSGQLRSGGRSRRDVKCSLLVLISFGLSVGGGCLRGKPLVLLLDLGELAHVFEEVGASLESDEQLRLLAAFGAAAGTCTLTLAGDWDGHGADGLEHRVLVPAPGVSKIEQWSCRDIAPRRQKD